MGNFIQESESFHYHEHQHLMIIIAEEESDLVDQLKKYAILNNIKNYLIIVMGEDIEE